MKIFLGGTCNGSTWRDELIPLLEKMDIDYFNPVLPSWTEEGYLQELLEREQCDLCLYVITPRLHGYYSIAEVVDDSNKRPEKVVMCVLEQDVDASFSPHQLKSLHKVGTMVAANGGTYCEGMHDLRQQIEAKSARQGRRQGALH